MVWKKITKSLGLSQLRCINPDKKLVPHRSEHYCIFSFLLGTQSKAHYFSLALSLSLSANRCVRLKSLLWILMEKCGAHAGRSPSLSPCGVCTPARGRRALFVRLLEILFFAGSAVPRRDSNATPLYITFPNGLYVWNVKNGTRCVQGNGCTPSIDGKNGFVKLKGNIKEKSEGLYIYQTGIVIEGV
jgi:hypothetical protein